MHFTTKNNSPNNFDITYKNKKLAAGNSIKFLGLTLDTSLSWKKNIEAIVPKLSAATFAMSVLQPFLSLDSLKLIYFSYFHSVLTYRIIFCGNTPSSNVIFRIPGLNEQNKYYYYYYQHIYGEFPDPYTLYSLQAHLHSCGVAIKGAPSSI